MTFNGFVPLRENNAGYGHALARILSADPASCQSAGAGFLVSPRHVLTCVRAVTDALGIPRDTPDAPGEPVPLDFPLFEKFSAGNNARVQSKVLKWYPAKDGFATEEYENIAILELISPLPGAIQPVPIVVLVHNALFKRAVRLCGFSQNAGNCEWLNGQLRGLARTGRVQLDNALARRSATPEFNGAAVWDKQENAVAGMMVSGHNGDAAASMIPISTLVKAWAELDRHCRPPNPYQGLYAFAEADAEYFFGREEAVSRLQKAVQQHPFVALTGACGSGKTSLVCAGLLPRLRYTKNWLIARFRPRNNPFDELALALAPLLCPDKQEQAKEKLAEELEAGEIDLTEIFRRIRENHPGQRLLIVCDRFEELSLNADPAQRRQFIDLLTSKTKVSPENASQQRVEGSTGEGRSQDEKESSEAISDIDALTSAISKIEVLVGAFHSSEAKRTNSQELSVLMLMRTDFLSQAIACAPIANALISCPCVILGPMDETALKAVIEKPAAKAGVTLEDGLTGRILQDLGPEPESLSLLSFALTCLWERPEHGCLTHAAYEAIGGVNQALKRYTDAIHIGTQEQQILRKILPLLARPGEGTEDIRRIAVLEPMQAEDAISRLADARLLITARRESRGQITETVELVHETLIRHWQPLQDCVNEQRSFTLWRYGLHRAMQRWENADKQEQALLRGVRLAETEEKLEAYAHLLSPTEQAYIKAGVALRARELQEAEYARRQQRRLHKRIIIIAMAALAFAAAFGWLAAE
ncbi:MAG: AAA family ATPase [Gammaproteobacteria bacterium]|nr:AAA family ATPase [Gammaproteobacteria bacterium]